MNTKPQPDEHLSPHFKRKELACPHCGEARVEQALIDALEALRSIIQRPIIPTSGYRCPVHNAAVGGARNSQHMLGRAADIRVPRMTPRDVYAAALHVAAFHGFGVADHQGYLHVDVRPGPQIVRWTYDKNGKQQPWRSNDAA